MNKTIIVEVAFTRPENGGRVQLPEGTGYPPHLTVMGDDFYHAVRFIEFPSNARFEEMSLVEIELMYYPKIDYSKLSSGIEFEIREGSRIVGKGIVK